MTLLLTIYAAIISTVLWYRTDNSLRFDLLCWMFWGASIMWFGDACFEYAEQGAAYFNPVVADLLNDTLLGLHVIALALIIWVVALLIKDPLGTVRKRLFGRK